MEMFPRKRAILIGADKYERLKPLDYCGDDVREIAREFREALQFKEEDILEFRVGATLLPKRTDILANMGSFLTQGVRPDELLVFYFSGHGMIDPEDQKDYLLPIDAAMSDLSGTGLAVDLIISRLTKTRCKNIVMFIDACREAVGGAKGLLSVGEHSREALLREGIVTFFACDPREKSYEISDLRHGSFTHCLLGAIARGDCATVDSIDKYLREHVPLVNTKYQKPVQKPFTIISPAEKGQLAIFYRHVAPREPSEKFSGIFVRLGELHADGVLEDKDLNSTVCLVERAMKGEALSTLDARKLGYIELLCAGKFTPMAFKVAWETAERRSVPAPPLSGGLA